MKIYYVRSEENVADALTKNVPRSGLDYFVKESGLISDAAVDARLALK